MLVTERPGRLRVIRNGVLDPTPIGPLPAMLARSLGGLLDVSLHPRFADNHLIYLDVLEAGPRRREQRDDCGLSRAMGWRLDPRRREGHLRRQCLSRRTGQRSEHGPGNRQLRIANRVGQERLDVRHARRSQHRKDGAGARLAHRQDRAAQRRRQRAARQSVRRQARLAAEIYTLGHRNPLGLAFDVRKASSGPRKKVRRAATS